MYHSYSDLCYNILFIPLQTIKKIAIDVLIQQCTSLLLKNEAALSDLSKYCERYFSFCQGNKSFLWCLHSFAPSSLIWGTSFHPECCCRGVHLILVNGKEPRGWMQSPVAAGSAGWEPKSWQDAVGRTPCPIQRYLYAGCFQSNPGISCD